MHWLLTADLTQPLVRYCVTDYTPDIQEATFHREGPGLLYRDTRWGEERERKRGPHHRWYDTREEAEVALAVMKGK